MSEDTGDTRGQLLNFPTPGDVLNQPPQLADPGRLFPDTNEGADIPPESPEETTMELPPIPAVPNPTAALRSEEISAAGADEEIGEYEEGEYVQPRSLADRLGDWLEFRLEAARDRHAGEASFREAEIARKAALLEGRTAQEVAMMEQNGKLHAAMMKAKADKAAARGRADADRTRSSGSGLGADKGRSKAGGGGGTPRSGGSNSGGSGRGSSGGRGGGNSPGSGGKGSDRSAGGRNNGAKGNESSGGSKGRQNGSGGSGKGGSGKGGGSGNSGSGKGDGGRTQNSPASGRQERAAARQAARQQRRNADQAAGLADRSKDRDQARANRQAEREERRKAKAERKAAKREAATSADGRTTLGAAVAEEAQQRWDKRRADVKDKKADKADRAGAEKVNLSKGKDKDKDKGAKDTKGAKDGKGAGGKGDGAPKEAPDAASSARKDDPASDEPGKASGAGDGPSGGSGTGKPKGGRSKGGRSSDSPFGPEDSTPTAEWPDHPARPPRSADDGEEDIVDAVIVEDAADPFRTSVSGPAGLPRAPESHTQRPGTTRPTAQEDPVTEVNKTASGQAGLAAKHRTDITFGEYLTEIVNIAIAAALDKDRAQDLAVALDKVADALRDMATDLVGDHNIATEVVGQITDLADAATRMKQLAERCATECEVASEAARIAAMSVGQTYGQDIQAMDDAGLAHASTAAHHN
ncbi:ATP/GTP-binding protein [Streptomyces sp. NPDC001231]|uniref:ATP/GTP-binding protein n=1 Tax=Streptomyces sp. NPDC001231 TaxID=3364549 RepID=UPI0036B11115